METLGPRPFARNPDGSYLSAIGTLFPRHRLLITEPPIHSFQRARFMEWLQRSETAADGKPWTKRRLYWEAAESVDLVFEPGDVVLIRPEVERLDLAFQSDQLLQDACEVPKHRIRFARTHDPRVRQALRERGELWRMFSVVFDRAAAIQAIRQSRVAIRCQPIYYYNAQSGTRWLTYQEFAGLGRLDDDSLARQLDEIREHCDQRNRHGNPELAFFGVDPLKFGAPLFNGPGFGDLAYAPLRARYGELARMFREATDKLLREDDVEADYWRARMLLAITGASERNGRDDPVLHPGVESMLKLRWLPGGRFEQGEFIFESFLPTADAPPDNPELVPFWDSLARGFIANFIREYGNLEHLNLARVEATTTATARPRGRRGVYLAELKVRDEPQARVLFLRVQRWGIAERLAEVDAQGRPRMDLVGAILETEEYLDYTLDRRLGCLQFGMHLPPRVHMRRVTERYQGVRTEYRNLRLPVIYFEREYLAGLPTNRVPERKLQDPRYAFALARLLGTAAAPNLVVGRTLEPATPNTPGEPLFDNGDEIIVEGSDGLPRHLFLVDHSGAFTDWRTPTLLPFAQSYAGPANCRAENVADPRAFAEAYLAAFREELQRVFRDYELRKAAFDGLFKHLTADPAGNFAYRWSRVLERLARTDVEEVLREVQRHIASLI